MYQDEMSKYPKSETLGGPVSEAETEKKVHPNILKQALMWRCFVCLIVWMRITATAKAGWLECMCFYVFAKWNEVKFKQ